MSEWYALRLPSGKWYSRGRFDALWDRSFELNRPELWDQRGKVEEELKGCPEGTTIEVFRGG